MKQEKKQRTLYDVLGVPPNAKVQQIGLAYDRFKTQQEREDAIPDPRLAAQMKVAFETLSDPDKRAEYDRTLDARVEAGKPRKRPMVGIVAGVVALVAAAIVASMYASRQKEAAANAPPTKEQLIALGEQLMAPVEEMKISGEVSKADVALAVAKNQMVMPCHSLAAGAQITVGAGDKAARAELERADAERDICLLRVKETGDTLAKWRVVEPPAGEKIYAVVRPSQIKEGSITRVIPDAKGGRAFQVSLPADVPNGTPVLDGSGRVVGIVTTPHEFGADMVAVLGASRITEALGAPAANPAAK
jgi:hypothetical protein